jgi:hypothetical protein
VEVVEDERVGSEFEQFDDGLALSCLCCEVSA